MKKLLFLLIAPLLSFVLIGCDKDDDVKPIDLQLLEGVWEVVAEGDQDVFRIGCCLDISTDPQNNFGSLSGNITTFFLTATDNKIYDKVYGWSISEIENHQPLLNVVFLGDLDSLDPSESSVNYKIIKLNDTHMWWQLIADGDTPIIMFKRHSGTSSN
ncbi:MAG: hypothetical protein K2M93_04465 [Muribaculaceae bacterium]|nr:hypothetical protein [Muribaculaceae bacterium]